jgi:hypothetical protein
MQVDSSESSKHKQPRYTYPFIIWPKTIHIFLTLGEAELQLAQLS